MVITPVKVKICCIRSPEEAQLAVSFGAAALGLVSEMPVGPGELADSMWSLSEASGRRRIDRDALLSAWLERLGPLYEDLSSGRFDSLRWADAQITTGATVAVETDGATVHGTAVGFDRESGALLVRTGPGHPLSSIAVGDVVRCSVEDVA